MMQLKEEFKALSAVCVVFFILGFVFGNWVSRIPDIKEALELSKSQLSIALLMIPLGGVCSMQIMSRIISVYGVGKATGIATLLYCGSILIPGWAPSYPLLVIATFFFGAGFGIVDVGMNANANVVELRHNNLIMSRCHALFSLGSMLGGAIGSVVESLAIDPSLHFTIVGLVSGIVSLVIMGWLIEGKAKVDSDEDEQTEQTNSFVLPSQVLLGLGILFLCVMFSEGAIADWSAIYFREYLGVSAGLDNFGFVMFYSAHVSGRLLGDWSVEKFGNRNVTLVGSSLAAIGISMTLVTADYQVAILGLACMGLGLSSLGPIIFRIAGSVLEGNSEKNISFVAMTGYFGFLSGPPLIGFAAGAVGLHNALFIICLFCLLSVVLSYAIPTGNKAVIPILNEVA
ncbi:MAG: MFS transporter [Cyanobacteria bacterium]|nr:MFS transporter [Cyanobacteriota bacterium]